MNRRQFFARSGTAAAGFYIATNTFGKISPNEKLNLGVIGVAHRAGDDLHHVSTENIVALCDVNETYLNEAKAKHPGAALYSDYRKMLERTDLDAIVIGTPDHIHAVATAAALKSGRHVYCEKPLTHTVSEARRIAQLAKEHNRITQMGTQIHATANYHEVATLIQSGIIGPVREAHVWISKVYTAKGLPTDTPAVPAGLNWDLWLGPVDPRAYSPAYVPQAWRDYWAFGGGTLADMGCHYIDLVHWALELRHPLTVEAEGPPVDAEGTSEWLVSHWQYPARGTKPPVKMTWSHGKRDGKDVRPAILSESGMPPWGPGILFIGDKGMMIVDYAKYLLLPHAKFANANKSRPKVGEDYDFRHHQEWIHAIKTNGKTASNFDYAGALTEAVLLGNVAYRTGSKIDWDADALKARGNAKADEFIQHHYKSGWEL